MYILDEYIFMYGILLYLTLNINKNNVFSISEVEKRWVGSVFDSVDVFLVFLNVRRRSRDTFFIIS